MAAFSALVLISLSLLQFYLGTRAATLTITNSCIYIIWPAVVPNTSSPPLFPSGFSLNPGNSETLPVPLGWSGRVWARTHCAAPSADVKFSCATGDCGSSDVYCNGGSWKFSPPATVAEFTINEPPQPDTYSVSVVDGYNLPLMVVPKGPAESSATVGCAVDLGTVNSPADLRVSYGGGNETVGLKSACEAYGEAEYCCSDESNYSSAKVTCKQNSYSELFKNWCPQARTFSDDNNGTTFTSEAEDYVVNFCPPSSGFPSSPTGTGYTPAGQASNSIDVDCKETNSKFGIIIGVSVAVLGVVILVYVIYSKRKPGEKIIERESQITKEKIVEKIIKEKIVPVIWPVPILPKPWL